MSDEKPIWGIHMDWYHQLRPVEQGFVAIGWESLGDLSKLPPSRDAFKKAVAATYPQMKPGAVPVNAGTLYKFAVEMSKGDLVVYPSKPDRMINLGIVESAYIYDPGSDDECPNRRKVRWVRHLARAEFSQAALYEIGSAVTLFQVKNNAEEFLAAFEGKPLASTDIDEEGAVPESQVTEDSAKDFVIKRLKTKLTSYQFEQFIGHLLERMGYYARVTQASGDSGVDIIAHKDVLGFEPPIIKVQCKQTFGNIGQPEVAQLYGHIQHGECALFVTLGAYTTQAKHFERGKHNLRLIGGEELAELVFEHYDRFDPKYQTLLPLKRCTCRERFWTRRRTSPALCGAQSTFVNSSADSIMPLP